MSTLSKKLLENPQVPVGKVNLEISRWFSFTQLAQGSVDVGGSPNYHHKLQIKFHIFNLIILPYFAQKMANSLIKHQNIFKFWIAILLKANRLAEINHILCKLLISFVEASKYNFEHDYCKLLFCSLPVFMSSWPVLSLI